MCGRENELNIDTCLYDGPTMVVIDLFRGKRQAILSLVGSGVGCSLGKSMLEERDIGCSWQHPGACDPRVKRTASRGKGAKN